MRSIQIGIATAIAMALMLATVNPSWGQASCLPRSEALAQLAKKYGEVQVAIGVTNKGGLIEVLTSSGGNTWTILVSNPNGTSCLVAAGEGWRTMPRDDSKSEPRI